MCKVNTPGSSGGSAGEGVGVLSKMALRACAACRRVASLRTSARSFEFTKTSSFATQVVVVSSWYIG